MKLIIGLGNPGKEFVSNRHNVGERFIRKIREMGESGDYKLVVSDCFMNESGKFVAREVKKYQGDRVGRGNGGNWGENLFIVHDDLDLRFGTFKIDFAKGPKVHNGLLSIEQTLGTKDFWRVRIGTDSRRSVAGKLGDTGKEYVLDDFSDEEIIALQGIFPKIWEEMKKLI